MDLENAEKKLNQVDRLLTTLTRILKKHWLILLLIVVGIGVYYFITAEDEEVYEDDEIENVVPANDSTATQDTVTGEDSATNSETLIEDDSTIESNEEQQ